MNQKLTDDMHAMPGYKLSNLGSLIGVLMLAGLAACAPTGALTDVESGTAAEGITARYAEGRFESIEMADRALAEVSTAREKIRQQFAMEERACYDRFFTNRCLNEVKDRERSALVQLRHVEVDANAYKRREKVERRDERLQQQEKRRLHIPADAAPTLQNSAPEASREVQGQ